LRLLCAPHGTVTSACVIRSKITGQPFGYRFVETGSADEPACNKRSVLSEGKLVRAELNEDNMVVDIYPTHRMHLSECMQACRPPGFGLRGIFIWDDVGEGYRG